VVTGLEAGPGGDLCHGEAGVLEEVEAEAEAFGPQVAHRGRAEVAPEEAHQVLRRNVGGGRHLAQAEALLEALAHRVSAVSPSLAMHPFLAKVTSDELLHELKQREAFGRAAEPWEVANVMVFLASDYSSYLTGEVVSVSSQHA
jgi:3-oxoacyl-[acyl-carrier protein] reductase